MWLIFFELGIALVLLLIVAWALRAAPGDEDDPARSPDKDDE